MKYSLGLRKDKIFEEVQKDIEQRKVIGQSTYGTTLETAEIDCIQYAYEEALDLTIYLKNELIKRENNNNNNNNNKYN